VYHYCFSKVLHHLNGMAFHMLFTPISILLAHLTKGHVSFCHHLTSIIFRNRLTRNKNCLWRQCLLVDREEMSNLYRGPSIYASYQVSFWPSGFTGEDSDVLSIGHKAVTWAIWLLIGWNLRKSSHLKLGGTMNCYFVGMVYMYMC
jgi:hypothetical protein